jgi:hypothetical protein
MYSHKIFAIFARLSSRVFVGGEGVVSIFSILTTHNATAVALYHGQPIRQREQLCCAIHSTHLGYVVLNPFGRSFINHLVLLDWTGLSYVCFVLISTDPGYYSFIIDCVPSSSISAKSSRLFDDDGIILLPSRLVSTISLATISSHPSQVHFSQYSLRHHAQR